VSSDLGRTFFDKRYTFPGYTFLILVLGGLSSWIVGIVENSLASNNGSQSDLLAVIIGSLFLLNGSPVGFLVSQPWFLVHKFVIAPRAYVLEYRKTLFGEPDILTTSVIIDFEILRRTDERQFSYIQRRWDLLNLLGSEIFAIPLGLLAAWLLQMQVATALSIKFSPLILTDEFLVGAFALTFLSLGLISTILEHRIVTKRLLNNPVRLANQGFP
jgi:hypothetical protein